MTTRIGFSTPKHFNPVSWLVRKITGSEASHAFFIYYDHDWDVDMVMEAHEVGFRILPLDHFEKKNELVATFTPRTPIDEGLKYVALEYLGTMYDYGGLFGGIFTMIGKWFKRQWHNPWQSKRSVFCSEAVVIALQKVNYLGSAGLDSRDTTPQDLLNFFAEGDVPK